MVIGTKYRDRFTDDTIRVIAITSTHVQYIADSGRMWLPITDFNARFRPVPLKRSP